MSVRRETIILEMEDRASDNALRAAGAFKTLDASLDGIDGHATTVNRRFTSLTQRADKLAGSMGKANTELGRTSGTIDAMGSVGLVRFSKQTDTASASIDRFSGRAALLGTAIATIGPAAIPIGAAAVPALVSLVAGMGAAAGAAGVLSLAFNGVGDAVSAVSDYRLEPTAQNLAKVREEMERLGPEGARFVMAIDKATPALRDLQQTARAGIFPGWERGLDELMTQLPGVRDLVADLSSTVGELGEASADALVNDADWQEFFDHIGTDGASALDAFGRATGNVVAGAANLVEALTDLAGDSSGLVETSRDFREWADNLEHTDGFKEFADYVRANGPRVVEFLGATGGAMVGIAEAAAPWGQAVLPALTALADLTGALASSPIGPPLFTAAAGMLAFNKASELLGPRLDRAKTSLAGIGTSLRQTGADLKTVAGGWTVASSTTQRESAAIAAASSRLKGSLAEVGKQARTAGPGIAAFGFMASGAADKMGLSNTALLTMAGAMAGPWGAAAGAAIGLAIDFAKANDDVEKSVTDASSAIASANFTEIGSQMRTAGQAVDDFKKDVESFNEVDWDFGDLTDVRSMKNWVEGIFGESDLEEVQDKLRKTRTEFSNLVDAGVKLGREFDIDVGGTQAQKLSALQELATAAGPAMNALGITFEDLGNAAARGDGSLEVMVEQITRWQATADSTAGRTEAVGDAIENLGRDALGAAHSADQLSTALQSLISPEQDLIAAQDAMSSVLNGLKDKVDGTNKSLEGTSDAAIKNRAAISAGVTAITNLSAAQAAAGESALTVATTMDAQRAALIKQGEAAGLSRKQVEALINQMGLTPDVIETSFKAAGIDGVDAKTQALLHHFNALPKKLRTDVATNGIPKSEADIERLTRKYHLTPSDVRTLASLKDNASGPIGVLIRKILGIPDKRVTVSAHDQASGVLARVKAIMDSLHDKSVTFTTIYHQVNTQSKVERQLGRNGMADGGTVPGPRYPYGDKIFIHAAPGEEIITNRNGEADRFRADRAAGRIPAYADGGTVGIRGYATGGTVRAQGTGDLGTKGWLHMSKMWERASKTTERALKSHEKQLERATDRLDYWNEKRNALKSAVTGSLTRDWMGDGNEDVWSGATRSGTVAYANQQWKTQAANSTKLARTIANLRKNGAGDAFIAEILNSSDPLAAAEMFNKQSVAGLRHSQSLYLSATRATASAANSASSIYADEQRMAAREVRHIRGDLKSLNTLLKKQHKENLAAQKKYSAAKSASRGSRSQHR